MGQLTTLVRSVCMDSSSEEALFRNCSEVLIGEGLLTGCALYDFSRGVNRVAGNFGSTQPVLESLEESDFYFLGAIEDSASTGLIPGQDCIDIFSEERALDAGQFQCFPLFKDGIPHAAFLLQDVAEPSLDWADVCTMWYLALSALSGTAGTDSEDAVDDAHVELKKRTFALDNVARASQDFVGMEPEELYTTFLLNTIGVAICESAALFLSQNQRANEFMVKRYKGVDEEIEDLILYEKLPLIRRLLQEKKPVILESLEAEEFSPRESALRDTFGFSAVFPMLVKDRVEALLFLGRRLSGQTFSGHVIDSVEILLNQLAMSLESNRLNEIKFAFSRYVTNQLIDELLEDPDNLKLGGTERDVTILFADIRNFTSMSEKLAPEEVVGILNTYMTALTQVIFKYEGTIDKYIGDCLMATFGVPVPHPDSPERAVLAAIEMQKTVTALNKVRKERGEREIKLGIGINSGTCISGNMGSTQRMDYTVIGDNVNVAARLEQLAKPGEILITEPLLKEVRYLITAEKFPPVILKGKANETTVWEVKGLISDRIVEYLESVDPEKNGFYRRVFHTALRVAEHMELDRVTLKKFRVALYMYDVGMIRLKESLRKSLGPFTEKQKKQLVKHTAFGAKILEKLQFFPEAIEAARSHHERWDGTGYPQGLKGEEIPLFARIIAVVDSFQAMQATRQYKEMYTKDEAVRAVESGKGVLFDPEVVAAFLEVVG